MKRYSFLVIGILIIVSGLNAAKSLASLEEAVARNPNNPRALYALTRSYCEKDSALKAIETWKRLADIDSELASDVFLIAKVAIYAGIEPFFPQPVSDSITSAPRFSPDAGWFTFHTYKKGLLNIATMDFSGNKFRFITDDDMNNFHPCFVGSKDLFLYVRNAAEGEGQSRELVYYNAESEEREVVLSNLVPSIEGADWVDVNQPLVFSYISIDTKSGEIGLYDRKVGKFTELTHNAYMDRYPRFSSNGKLITYSNDRKLQSDVYIMDLKGREKKRVTNWPGSDIYPDFGDRDRKIVFASDRNGGGQFDIFVSDLQSGEVIPITFDEANDIIPDMSEDGNWIVFQSNRGDGNPRAYVVSLNQPISAEKLLAELEKQGE